MADHQLNVTTGDAHLSESAKKRITESLKKTLEEELAKEHKTMGGTSAPADIGIGGHANVTTKRMA